MLVNVSSDAAAVIDASGGRLWVWAERSGLCCGGAPAFMQAATAEPKGVSGFTALPADLLPAGLEVLFRPAAGQRPDVLEIGLRGRRRPKVAAYWDGCLMAMV